MLDLFNQLDWFDSVWWSGQPDWWWWNGWILQDNLSGSWFH